MTDGEETAEDALRRFVVKYQEAIQLWDALEPREGDIILDAVIIGRLQNPNTSGTCISVGASDGVDFSRQLGMLHEAILIMNKQPLKED
jgi:hypothetical protein